MSFKHTEEKIINIKDSKKIKSIEEHLLSLREMLLNADFILGILEEQETNYTTNLETYIKNSIDYVNSMREQELKNFNAEENEDKKEKIEKDLTVLSEFTSHDFWQGKAQKEHLAITTLITQIKEFNFINSNDYINFIKYITSDKQAIEEEEETHDLAKRRILIIRCFEITCERIIREYIKKQHGELDEKANAYEYAINDFIDKELNANKKSALTFNMAMLTGAYFEFKHNIFTLYKYAHNNIDENIFKEENNIKRGYRELEETSEYSFTKDFSQIFLNTENKKYNIVESKLGNLEILLSGTEESEEKIEKLTFFDKGVLDAIISIFKSGDTEFTDVQICKALHGKEERKKGNYTKPTEKQLEEINRSIDKLRTTNIEIIGENNTKDEFYNSKNPFISVFNYGKRDNTSNTQNYKILSTPFYYTYNVMTGGKFIEYDRKVLTRRIAEVKKTPKNTSIRIYLLERISNIKNGLIAEKETPFIDLNEIYTIAEAKTRKQKYDTATTTENILDDLGKEYGTRKKIKYKGKTKIGYVIEVL